MSILLNVLRDLQICGCRAWLRWLSSHVDFMAWFSQAAHWRRDR